MNKQNDVAYDWVAKVLLVGDASCKKNILFHFCDNNLNPSHMTTIGVDFKVKTLEVEGKKLKMQIWDTAGQERFTSASEAFFKGAMGIILAYSIGKPETFKSAENWMKEIQKETSEHVCKILVGNKCDDSERAVSYEDGKKLAENYGIPFYETDAETGMNINEVFMKIATDIKNKVEGDKNNSKKG